MLAYWYLQFDNQESMRMNRFLISLVRQVASQWQGFADDDLLKWLGRHQTSGRIPTKTSDILTLLKTLITDIDVDVFIILNGLDPVPDRHREVKDEAHKLLDIISDLLQHECLNLLISREEKDIRERLETDLTDIPAAKDVTQESGQELENTI